MPSTGLADTLDAPTREAETAILRVAWQEGASSYGKSGFENPFFIASSDGVTLHALD